MTKAQEKKVQQWLDWFHAKAEKFYNRKFKKLTLDFNLHGTNAGVTYFGSNKIKINKEVWKYGNKEVKGTIGHEAAHCYIYQKYKDKVKDHGTEWKELMRVFRCPDERCHDLDLTPARKESIKVYCGCRTRRVTKEKAEKYSNGELKFCPNCLQPISNIPYTWINKDGVSDVGMDLEEN